MVQTKVIFFYETEIRGHLRLCLVKAQTLRQYKDPRGKKTLKGFGEYMAWHGGTATIKSGRVQLGEGESLRVFK